MNLPSSFSHLTIAGGVRSAAHRIPDKAALIFEDAELTYAQLINRINRLANAAMTVLHLKQGDHAALMAPNCLEYIEIMCGIADGGVAVATPNSRSSSAELTAICNDAAVKVLFVHPDCAAIASNASLESVERVVILGPEYEELLAVSSPDISAYSVEEWSPFSIPYTSGTTGKPKGVLISHRARVLSMYACAVEYGVYSPDDYFYAIAPLCHGAGFNFAMASIFFGGTCEIAGSFDAETTLEKIHEGRVTGIFVVPTHLHQIFDLDADVLAKNKGHNLRGMLCNAAALPQATKEKTIAYFGDGILHELYGSTEAGIVSSLRPADQLRKQQCVGLPFPNTQIRLLDEQGTDVGPGEIGELFSISPYSFNGYWQRDEETQVTLVDGWVGVGDLAKFDEDGFLYIVGRKKDLVISGGVNIYPREIEEIICKHSAVKDAAVVGVPDEAWGERLVAFVELGSGQEITADDIKAICRAELSPYKVPREIAFLAQLPRNLAGKVLKADLRDNYAQ